MAIKHKLAFKLIRFSLLIAPIIFCSLSFAWYYNWDGPTENEGQSQALRLIEALDAYKKQNGAYPIELEELVPVYLITIPSPSWRQEYVYLTNDDRSRFSINFEEKGQALGDGFCGYRSVTSEWKCTDSSLTYP
jgi:hypothetical protein